MKPYRIRRLAVTASTNDDAISAAEAGEAEGLVVQALTQTAGRGRHGRQWQSREGNIHCTALLRPADRKSFGLFGFVASLAVLYTVKAYLPDAAVALKWPNDVLANGKKISGILLEAGADYLVVGIGVNVLHHPEDALYPSTSLVEAGAALLPSPRGRGWGRGGDVGIGITDLQIVEESPQPHSPLPNPPLKGEGIPTALAEKVLQEILDKLLDRLWHWYGLMKTEGFAPVRAAWLDHAKKGRMTVKLPGGTVEGVFETVDAEGHLRLRLADGTERAIATGDVFF